jgi:hypothetical protein
MGDDCRFIFAGDGGEALAEVEARLNPAMQKIDRRC